MATRIAEDPTIPSGFAEVTREPQAMRISHAEEGDSRGEGWFLLRAVALLVAVIVAVGWLIG
jgi:hypothetical protein